MENYTITSDLGFTSYNGSFQEVFKLAGKIVNETKAKVKIYRFDVEENGDWIPQEVCEIALGGWNFDTEKDY